MPAMAAGWSSDSVRPSKMPQSGPAAEALRGVEAIIMAAVAMAATWPLLLLYNEDEDSSADRLSGSNDPTTVVSKSLLFSIAAMRVVEERRDVGTVNPVALVAKAASRIRRIMVACAGAGRVLVLLCWACSVPFGVFSKRLCV